MEELAGAQADAALVELHAMEEIRVETEALLNARSAAIRLTLANSDTEHHMLVHDLEPLTIIELT